MLGLETQLRDWQAQIPARISRLQPVLLGQVFTHIFICCAPLVKVPAPAVFTNILAPEVGRVASAVPLIRRYYEIVSGLDLRVFSAMDWSRLIICAILGMRLSFPIAGFHCWDYVRVRTELGFAEFLDAASSGGEKVADANTARGADIGKAGSVIFNVVKKKYNSRLEMERRLESGARATCPVLDGSLDEYLNSWDEVPVGDFGMVDPSSVSLSTSEGAFGSGSQGDELGVGHQDEQGSGVPMYHDLWATMTMAWPGGDAGPPDIQF